MLYIQNWVKIGALLAFSFAALYYTVLGIYILADNKTTKAGIMTLIIYTYPSCNAFTLLISS